MEIGDIKYLAGLLEGEGYFHINQTPSIRLQMTDEDIVVKARNLMSPNSRINIEYPKRPNRLPTYGFHVGSNLAISWMMTLYSLMGRRRKEKIREVIKKWKEMPGRNESCNRNISAYNAMRMIASFRKISMEEAKKVWIEVNKVVQ